MELNKTQTKDGNIKYDVIIGDVKLTCYKTVTDSYAVHGKKLDDVHKAKHYCTLKESIFKSTLEECEKINKFGGDCIEYLKTFKTRQSRPEYISKDGEVRGYYHFDKEKKGFVPKCKDHGVTGHISKVVNTEEEAEEILQKAIKEYDETGKYPRYLDRPHKTQLPSAYVVIKGTTSLDKPGITMPSYYTSIADYLENKFDENGRSLLRGKETLDIWNIDGSFVPVSRFDCLRFNSNRTLLIIASDETETVIHTNKISKVVLHK